jgi:hypothetical protein
MKDHMQCPIVLSVKAGWRQCGTLEREKRKAMRIVRFDYAAEERKYFSRILYLEGYCRDRRLRG